MINSINILLVVQNHKLSQFYHVRFLIIPFMPARSMLLDAEQRL